MVEELLEVDLATLSDDELSSLMVGSRRERARLDAGIARLTSEWDRRRVWDGDDAKSGAAWISHSCKLPIGEASEQIKHARALRHLRYVAAAFEAGEISGAHVRLLCAVMNPRTELRLIEDQKVLLDAARELGFAGFVTAVKYWSQLADPDGVEDEAELQREKRGFTLVQTIGGMWFGNVTLPAVAGMIVKTVLDAIEKEMFEADWAEARDRVGSDATESDLRRTPAQRRHDAFVEMAIRAATAPRDGRRPAPLFTVLVGLETLKGRVLELANGAAITPGQAAEHLDGADLERIVFDGPSRVIDVGRRTRLFLGALRRAIEVRDRHCTGFACRTPADQCLGDHVLAFADGGETTQANGQLQCGFHNRRKGRRPPPPPS